jgi:hypothetical protein
MDLSLQKLQFPGSLLPEAGDIFRRYAPDGIKADIRVKGNASGNEFSSSFQFLLHGLGKLDAAAACSGDLQAVLASALSKHAGADFMKLLTKVRMKQASLSYEDSGCAALALEVAAKNAGMPPLAFRDALDARLGKVLEDETVSGVLADASRIFREQLYAPGKVSAALAQGKSLTMAQFALAALMQPAKLPVTLSSEAGQRRMEEYFQ